MEKTARTNYDFQLDRKPVALRDDVLIISGLASNFDVDRVNDQVTRAALERALDKYQKSNPILLYNHSYAQPAGVVTKAFIDDLGLHIEAALPRPESGTPRHYWNLVRDGVMRALSIGGVWQRKAVRGVQQLIEIDLREISVAAVGVNPHTTFSVQMAKAFADPAAERDAVRGQLRDINFELGMLRVENDLHRAKARLGIW